MQKLQMLLFIVFLSILTIFLSDNVDAVYPISCNVDFNGPSQNKWVCGFDNGNSNQCYSHSTGSAEAGALPVVETIGIIGTIPISSNSGRPPHIETKYIENSQGTCAESKFRDEGRIVGTAAKNGWSCAVLDQCFGGGFGITQWKGYWDDSENQCVVCKPLDTSGAKDETGKQYDSVGDTSQLYSYCTSDDPKNIADTCESACGASPECDEYWPNSDVPNGRCDNKCQFELKEEPPEPVTCTDSDRPTKDSRWDSLDYEKKGTCSLSTGQTWNEGCLDSDTVVT